MLSNLLSGFGETMVGVSLGGEAIREVGENLGGALGRATQSFIGLGVMSVPARRVQDFFRG